MKKMKYYEETSALLHEYFEELWESFNLAGFLYDEDYLREQIYLMMLDFSEAERDGMSAEDYLGKNPKKIIDLFGNCKKCYTIFMETVYDKAQKLNSKNFKLLIGVKKETFQL
ncbi:hypothetical protein PFI46_01095, partial [Streptococcus pneumoniae]|nr:hypothetical protein [Streptococcus pneumoniae]